MTGDSIKSEQAEFRDTRTATTKTATWGCPGRRPQAHKNDCTHTYADGALRSIDRTASPSCGWRGVYAAMELNEAGQR